MYIDRPELFKQTIMNGINLFTGAGFSILPDCDGKVLPAGGSLAKEICERFDIGGYDYDLEKISNLANIKAKSQFQKYLREKYTVTSYNPLYEALNLITIKSYITTNIDNIVPLVMSNSKRYYLRNISHGPIKKSNTEIQYIPLHGCVNDINSHLYFGKNELANVDSDNKDLFDSMHSKLLEYPTLFVGYGFHDNSIERIIANTITNPKQDIWVMCLNGQDAEINYYRQLGCKIIVGDTSSFLEWINDNCKAENKDVQVDTLDAALKEYRIPDVCNVELIPKEQYFQKCRTDWYCIFNNYPYVRKHVDELRERLLSTKNIIVKGIPFSGKTTIAMQVAIMASNDYKLFINELTVERANYIINVLSNKQALIFVDNCCEDSEALSILMQCANLSVIGFTDDFVYESTKHKFENIKPYFINVTELELDEPYRIYEQIPESIRLPFSKVAEDEKCSMVEFIKQNVKDSLSEGNVKDFFSRIKDVSYKGFEVVALATYLSKNGSALNTDVLCSYFDTTDYSVIKEYISIAQNCLRDMSVALEEDLVDQDYYLLRSHVFVYLSIKVLMRHYKTEYQKIVKRLILNVSPYKIYRYNVFKRSAYDSSFFNKLFGNDADLLYKHLLKHEYNAYTLQQWALYKAYTGDYEKAFRLIDEAIGLKPNNLSMKNTNAIIKFEANKNSNSEYALEEMKSAMEILRACYMNDERKSYHANKYAEFALFLKENKNNSDYIESAKEWLTSICSEESSVNRISKRLLTRINSVKF